MSRVVTEKEFCKYVDLFENDTITFDDLFYTLPMYMGFWDVFDLAIDNNKVKLLNTCLDHLEVPRDNMNMAERISYYKLFMNK